MKINILTYSVPHRKTYDVLCLLKAKGYNNVTVFAKPLSYTKKYKPLIEHRPPVTFRNVEYIKNLSDKYIEITDYSEICVDESDVFLLCGAALLPDDFISKYKVVNAHPGYIPQVRGLDSLKWAICEDLPIGVTTHVINKDFVDAGDIIERKLVEIYENDTFHAVAYRQYELEIVMLVNAVLKANKPFETIKPDSNSIYKRMPNEIERTLFDKFEAYKVKRINEHSVIMDNTPPPPPKA